MESPCNVCERIGCGAYHDQCEVYQNYKRKKEQETIARTEFNKPCRRDYVKTLPKVSPISPLKQNKY